jgi:hypothetical protein
MADHNATLDAYDRTYCGGMGASSRSFLRRFLEWRANNAPPIPMVLHCPLCHVQHVDQATETWSNPPHRSHLCHNCGCVWRPADVATVGVKRIETRGKADNWPHERQTDGN